MGLNWGFWYVCVRVMWMVNWFLYVIRWFGYGMGGYEDDYV